MPDNNVAPMLDDLPDEDASTDDDQPREADLDGRGNGAHEEKVQDTPERHDDADDPSSSAPSGNPPSQEQAEEHDDD